MVEKMVMTPGEKFNDWTFIEEVEPRGKSRRAVVKCVCGVVKETVLRDVYHGRSKGCGCGKIKMLKELNTITIPIGTKFGHWEVIGEPVGDRVPCRCVCGLEKNVKKQGLRSGLSKSCGCSIVSKKRINVEVGEKYGFWTIVEEVLDGRRERGFKCRCDCGVEKVVRLQDLRSGKSLSCGCYKNLVVGQCNKTHGLTRTDTYTIWARMMQRCRDKNDAKYPQYGGRGITVCEEWQSFEGFVKDMGMRPGKEFSIDRIDVNGNYEPSNCRWATNKQQANNKRNNRIITWKGETKTLSQWSEHLGIKYDILECRLNKHGWTVERAFTQPIRRW
jgi:hypothetical protein